MILLSRSWGVSFFSPGGCFKGPPEELPLVNFAIAEVVLWKREENQVYKSDKYKFGYKKLKTNHIKEMEKSFPGSKVKKRTKPSLQERQI